MARDGVMYLGTADGLYVAEPKGSAYETRLLGLQGKGMIRCPVVVDIDDQDRLYCSTNQGGVYRSTDGGASWNEINEGITYKETWSLVQHPTTGELYVGTGPTSVFKSVDRGDTWTDCPQLRTMPETKSWTFPGPPYISHVKGLGLCKDDPSLVFGAIEEGWTIRSQDGGQSWQNIREGIESDVHTVQYMPDNPAVVIATTGKGVYRSMHGGDAFEEANEGLDRRYMAQLVVHPERPKVLFTAGAAVPPPSWRRPQGADSGFYRSENQGGSWERLTGGLPELLTAAPRATGGDPADPDTFVAGLTDGSVWMTNDGGESFAQVISGLPPITSVLIAHR